MLWNTRISSKTTVLALKARIKLLENLLANSGICVPLDEANELVSSELGLGNGYQTDITAAVAWSNGDTTDEGTHWFQTHELASKPGDDSHHLQGEPLTAIRNDTVVLNPPVKENTSFIPGSDFTRSANVEICHSRSAGDEIANTPSILVAGVSGPEDLAAWELLTETEHNHTHNDQLDHHQLSSLHPSSPQYDLMAIPNESHGQAKKLSVTEEVGEDVVDQLSTRLGSLQVAEDGQLRLFGATSNLHIVHSGPESLSRPKLRSVRVHGPAVLARAGLDRNVDPTLEDHLIELYFAWEDPSIHVIDKETYMIERQRWRDGINGSAFYSEVLTNAM
jgi:hypothetical protein